MTKFSRGKQYLLSANDVQNQIEGEIALLVGKQKYTGAGRVCLGKKKLQNMFQSLQILIKRRCSWV